VSPFTQLVPLSKLARIPYLFDRVYENQAATSSLGPRLLFALGTPRDRLDITGLAAACKFSSLTLLTLSDHSITVNSAVGKSDIKHS
jgi:hypothetical protein